MSHLTYWMQCETCGLECEAEPDEDGTLSPLNHRQDGCSAPGCRATICAEGDELPEANHCAHCGSVFCAAHLIREDGEFWCHECLEYLVRQQLVMTRVRVSITKMRSLSSQFRRLGYHAVAQGIRNTISREQGR